MNMVLDSSQFYKLSAMPTAEKLTSKKLKITISKVRSVTEITEAEPQRSSNLHSRGLNCQFSVSKESGPTITSVKEKRFIDRELQTSIENCSGRDDIVAADKSSVQPSVNRTSKRGPVSKLDCHREKKQRIDSSTAQQCATILRRLMTDPVGWVFNQPVDPVLLKIPDYFSIIAKPMDLGTIKSKLQKKLYLQPEEFAADVRLTFSNAMLYNPPGNDVHGMAVKLSNIFESRWKSLETKWKVESTAIEQHPISKEGLHVSHVLQRDRHKTSSNSPDLAAGASTIPAQKQELRKNHGEISSKCPAQMIHGFRKCSSNGQNEEKMVADCDALDDKVAVDELQRVVKNDLHLKSADSASGLTETSCGRDFLRKDLHQGSGISGNASGSVSVKSHSNPSVRVKGPRDSIKSDHSHNCDFTEASSDIDSERSSGRDNSRACHVGRCKLDLRVDDTAKRRMSKLDPESDGAVSTVDEDAAPSSSRPETPVTIAASGEGVVWDSNAYDEQLSPSKALRAAVLRSRFADTILKAQHKTLLENGEKCDPMKMKQEKERLEKQRREEKERIEAKVRAAEAALRRKEEAELKMKRERDREAARIALQKMEEAVEIYSNMEIMKELEKFCGSGDGVSIMFGRRRGNPLERLGLFMKDEYMEEEEEVQEKRRSGRDVEEGEIAC